MELICPLPFIWNSPGGGAVVEKHFCPFLLCWKIPAGAPDQFIDFSNYHTFYPYKTSSRAHKG